MTIYLARGSGRQGQPEPDEKIATRFFHLSEAKRMALKAHSRCEDHLRILCCPDPRPAGRSRVGKNSPLPSPEMTPGYVMHSLDSPPVSRTNAYTFCGPLESRLF